MSKDLTKLGHRLQVELFWARRRVFAEVMNAQRMKNYLDRRALTFPNQPAQAFDDMADYSEMELDFPTHLEFSDG